MAKLCDDTCDSCVYIGEGDFICCDANELVIVDWIPVHGFCIKKKKQNLFNEKRPKRRLKKK